MTAGIDAAIYVEQASAYTSISTTTGSPLFPGFLIIRSFILFEYSTRLTSSDRTSATDHPATDGTYNVLCGIGS